MISRPLEDILWEDFGALEKTLQSHGYRTHKPFSNGFVVYEVRKPDQNLPLNGAYFAARKSTSGYVDEALFWYAPNLTEASAELLKLPMPNEPIGPVKPVEAPQSRERIKAGNLFLASVAGASLLFLTTQDPILTFVGFCSGAIIYAVVPDAGNATFSNVLTAYRYVFPQMPKHKTLIKNLEGAFERSAQGRDAITMMLQLTEIYRISR